MAISTAPHYRPDLNGLRGLAAASVALFHAFPAWVPGGFAGVDLFFVLSGYLIAGGLRREARAGGVRPLDFYGRRVARLCPALALVLSAAWAMSLWLMAPHDATQLSPYVAAVALWAGNLVLAVGSGPMADTGQTNPLLHLWSLGVEAQWYLLSPWLFGGLAACRRVTACAVLAMLAMAAFAHGLWLASWHEPWAFYSPLARAWEFLLGAWLAFALDDAQGEPSPARAWQGPFATALALAAYAAALVWLAPVPSGAGLPMLWPAAVAAILVAAAGAGRVWLTAPPLVWLGRVSYPLYLWHWPLLAALAYAAPAHSPAARWAMLALSVVLAWATDRWVEWPVRRRLPGWQRRTAWSCAVLAVIALWAGGRWLAG